MHTFRDNAGRAWTVQIHVTAVKRCRALLNVDLYGLVDEGFIGLSKLLADPEQLVNVLYVLCKDEADKAGVSDEDFGCGLAGDSLEAAAIAFQEELADFFPSPRIRAGLRSVLEKSRQVRDLMAAHAEKILAEIDPQTEATKMVEEAEAKERKRAEAQRLIALSGNSPASLASIQENSPSAS